MHLPYGYTLQWSKRTRLCWCDGQGKPNVTAPGDNFSKFYWGDRNIHNFRTIN